MGALRWILLLLGLVFLAALAAWERLRPRAAQRQGAGRSSERGEPQIGTLGPSEPMATVAGEPGAAAAHMYTGASLGSGRTRSAPPPRIDLPPLEPLEPIEPGVTAGASGMRMADSGIRIDEPISASGPEPYVEGLAESAEGDAAGEQPLPGELRRSPRVDWPPEAERHILSLRIAALSHERMSGRVVRQALGACGFEHGRFGIFHQPGTDGRALLSAANLTKPGIFDLPTMDFQRFSGLSLFAVLPGPLPPAAALDHLLDTAQDLAERLRARLQDEQGLALGATQLENLRRTVQDLTSAERAEPAA
jgi:FtsZ-interacting cell division protein ZipA